MYLLQEGMIHALEVAISLQWLSCCPLFLRGLCLRDTWMSGQRGQPYRGAAAWRLRPWERIRKMKSKVWSLIWTLQGSQTWRTVTRRSSPQQLLMKPHETTSESSCVPVFWLGAKGIKNEHGERGRCCCGFLGGSSTDSRQDSLPVPMGGPYLRALVSHPLHEEPGGMQPFPGAAPRARQGNTEHLCFSLRGLSKSRKTQAGQNYEENLKWNNICLLKSWGRFLGLFSFQLMPGQFFFWSVPHPYRGRYSENTLQTSWQISGVVLYGFLRIRGHCLFCNFTETHKYA